MRKIQVGGLSILLDEEDFESLCNLSWHISSNGYVKTTGFTKVDGKYKTEAIYIHRKIMGLGKGDSNWVDHINGNKLDNRKENLRLCTPSQNAMNFGAYKSSKTGVRGVFFDNQKKLWCAQLKVKGEKLLKKMFHSYDEAVAARLAMEQMKYGSFAKSNAITV